jgi:hypothetical protein
MAGKDTVEFEEVPSETLARFLANQTFYRQEYGALNVKSLLFFASKTDFSKKSECVVLAVNKTCALESSLCCMHEV